jgi:hypothetical protein
MFEDIRIGDQAFVEEGGEDFGAIRAVRPGGREVLVVFVENSGEFEVPLDTVKAAHAQKVVFSLDRLDELMREAIARAHDAEEPGA